MSHTRHDHMGWALMGLENPTS